MVERKLISALITSIVSFFIFPFLFVDSDNSFLSIAFQLTAYTVPVIFTYGLLFSSLADWIAKNWKNREGISCLLHLTFGSLIIVPAMLLGWGPENHLLSFNMVIVTAGFILGGIFFLADLFLQKVVSRLTKYENRYEL